MVEKLTALLKEALQKPMSAPERDAQRRSFAYGNGALESDCCITRLSVDMAATTKK